MLLSLEIMVKPFRSDCVISDEDKASLPETETDWGGKDSVERPYKPRAVGIDTMVIGLHCISNKFSLSKRKKIAKKENRTKIN